MNHKVLAGIFGALLIFSSIMGVIASLNFPEAEAFAQEELHVPDQFISQGLEPMPPLAGDWPTLPNIPALISIGNIYREYGGSVRIQIQNNGTRDIFLEQVAFEWTNSGRGSSIMVHQYIDTGSAYDVKTLSIPGPSTAGNHSYQISMQVLIYRNNGWFRVIAGGDDWLDLTEHTIEVVELVEPNEYDLEHNYRAYYERVNELVSFDSENVASAAAAATEGMGDEYNIGKVCAIFDYLDDNCVYTEDPGGDKWYSPDELLDSLEGDCEDYAMLIAAMVENIGGTTRVYLTHDHAFAAVYVGNSTEEYEQASNDIQSYYGTDVKTHAMVDETGYWINVDPLGTFYAGGLAVGQSPTELYNGNWNTTFEESDMLHSIDVTGLDLAVPIWMEPNFWMGMILIFGFIAVMAIMSVASDVKSTKTMCHICAGEIGQDLYMCPGCQTTFHRHCAFENAYCMTCQKPIQFPPPPPPQI